MAGWKIKAAADRAPCASLGNGEQWRNPARQQDGASVATAEAHGSVGALWDDVRRRPANDGIDAPDHAAGELHRTADSIGTLKLKTVQREQL